VALREIDIFTSLTPDEAHSAISRVVRPPLAWGEYFIRLDPRQPKRSFHGTVDSRTFEIIRVIGYKNSFLPVIRGEPVPAEGGTRLHLAMKWHITATVFMCLWLGGLASVVLLAMFGVIAEGRKEIPDLILMLIAGGALAAVCFYPEARKAEKLLRDALAPPR
jgi:hypothetical protein